MDYDEMHIHPVNKALKDVIDSQNHRSARGMVLDHEREFIDLAQYYWKRTNQKVFNLASAMIVAVSLGRVRSSVTAHEWVCVKHNKLVDFDHLMGCSELPRLDYGILENLKKANPKKALRLKQFELQVLTLNEQKAISDNFLNFCQAILANLTRGVWSLRQPSD
jgi:hypothetical protein